MNTVKLTLGMAAKRTGKSKTTIHNAVKKGKISAHKDVHGHYEITPAELFRVYPMAFDDEGEPVQGEHPKVDETERHSTPENTETIAALKLVIEQQNARIEEKDKRLLSIETEMKKQGNLLEDQRSEAEKAADLLARERSKPSLKLVTRKATWRERLLGQKIQVAEAVQTKQSSAISG